MGKKTIITAALTGAVTPKTANPNIPLTPKEIAEDAYRAWKAGAAIVHLHMRDDQGYGCMDVSKFKETVDRIRNTTDLVINCTTSGGPTPKDEDRYAHVIALEPEMCSFDAGTFNWLPGGPFMNTADFLRGLGKVCMEHKVKPEIEVFDSGMINAAVYFNEKEHILETPMHFQFVLGVNGMAKATPQVVTHLYDMLPKGSTWSALGIGAGHLPVLLTTLALGGNVRVGLEDNIYYSKGQLATNVQLIERAARLICENNCEVATPDEAREILNLRK